MSWAVYIKLLAGTAVGLLVLAGVFIFIMNPYMNLPGAPELGQAPVSQNQRFAYPAIARDPNFDSIVVGTSTGRLLDPTLLGKKLGGTWANLSMNSATAYEQMKILDLFSRNRAKVRYVLMVLDATWCSRNSKDEKYTFRLFPEWMFDDSPWNDFLYMLNDKALENAVRMAELLSGRRSAKYETNGFRDFTLDFGQFDPKRSRGQLFPNGPESIPTTDLAPSYGNIAVSEFDSLNELKASFEQAAPKAGTIVIFPPLHIRYLARIAHSITDCKAAAVKILGENPKTTIIDFMDDTVVTRDVSNYWDPVHFTNPVARMIEDQILSALSTPTSQLLHARRLPTQK